MDEKRDAKGTWRWLQSVRWPYMTAQSWYDNKPTQCLSTIHTAEFEHRERGTRGGVEQVDKPTAVIDYTNYMGGVDLQDQKRSYHPTKLQVRRWPTHVFLWVLDAACVNSKIKYEHLNGTKVSMNVWKRKLAKQLVNLKKVPGRSSALPLCSPSDARRRREVIATARRSLAQSSSESSSGSDRHVRARVDKDTQWADHIAVRTSAKFAQKCVRCYALKKAGEIKIVHKSRMVCHLCAPGPRRGRKIAHPEIALCVDRRNQARSCFWLWHEARFGSGEGHEAAAAAAAAAQPAAPATPPRNNTQAAITAAADDDDDDGEVDDNDDDGATAEVGYGS